MFCPNCGTEANHELNYCKRCGGSLNPLAGVPPQTLGPPLSTGGVIGVGAITFMIVVGGLILLSITLSEMLRSGGMTSEALVWVFIFGALTILGSVALLLRFLLRMLGGTHAVSSGLRSELRPATKPGELGATTANMLPPERPLASVTEHTTRTFDMHERGQRSEARDQR